MAFSISTLYDASFDGQSFFEDYGPGSGFGAPAPAAPIVSSEIHLASGDNVLATNGSGIRSMEIPIGATHTDMGTLHGKKGNSGTLAYSAGTFTATLIDLRDWRKGPAAAGGDKAVLVFKVVS